MGALTSVRTVMYCHDVGLVSILANHLTRTGLFEVVTWTQHWPTRGNRIGAGFDKLKDSTRRRPWNEAGKREGGRLTGRPAQYQTFQRGSGFRARTGQRFLVDPRARRVLWSTWLPPSGMARDLDRAARSVVKRLESDRQKPGQ